MMGDFASALAPGGAAEAAGPPPGPLPEEPLPENPADEFDNSIEALDAAEDALHAFIRLDADEPDRAEASKALQIVLKLKASNQTSVESGDMKSLTRALASGGGAPGAGGLGY